MSFGGLYPFLAGGRPFPPPPDRHALCDVHCQMQGLTVAGRPWFETEIATVDAATRAEALRKKRALGDTHVLLTVALDGLASLDRLAPLADALIADGWKIILACCGDGNGSPDEPNYDPGALGWHWLMANFPAIRQRWGRRCAHTVFPPGFDGCVPGWQPWARVDAWAARARTTMDHDGLGGALALYLSAGFSNWSGESRGGGGDWFTAAGQAFDVIFQEFDPSGPHNDKFWQIAGRMVEHYVRPPDQPVNDDPAPPWYLRGGTPRGPFYWVPFELYTEPWTDGVIDPAEVNAGLQYMRAAGCPRVQGDVPV